MTRTGRHCICLSNQRRVDPWTRSLRERTSSLNQNHNGPTHHLRTFPTTPIIPTEHSPNKNIDSNNLLILTSGIPTRLEGRFQGPERSLPSRTDHRTLVLVGTLTYPTSSLYNKKHSMLPPLPSTSDLRMFLVMMLGIKIRKMRLRSLGSNWNRFVCGSIIFRMDP